MWEEEDNQKKDCKDSAVILTSQCAAEFLIKLEYYCCFPCEAMNM